MSPLVALVLIGFLFVIALCLTVWAALSWVSGPQRPREDTRATYVPLSRGEPRGPVWRAGTPSAPAVAASDPTVRRAASQAPESEAGTVTVRERRNDEFRGANATVTQRPNLDDAFDRFLDQERKDRG